MNDRTSTYNVFVLMPFKGEFDDVYMVIKDACTDSSLPVAIRCQRADDIAAPGRITDQIIESIKGANAIVADLTGSNPNVMYELGFAHALGKHTIIINQSVTASPFDVQALRQIAYDRTRLVKDCRPQLVKALVEVIAGLDLREQTGESKASEAIPAQPTDATANPALKPLRVSTELVAQLQALHLHLQVARRTGNVLTAQSVANDILGLLNRVAVFENSSLSDRRNFAAVIGNCAVEMESAHLYEEAENTFKRGIAFTPDFAGIHLQYADFLVDQGRTADAQVELTRARELAPDDHRAAKVEMKIALANKDSLQGPDSSIGLKIRREFEQDKANFAAAATYILYLSRSGAPQDEILRVCKEWEDALPRSQKKYARRVMADQLATTGQHNEAIPIYEKLLPEINGEERTHTLHNLATLYFHEDRIGDALKYWREAYASNRNDPAIRSSYSQALAKSGDLETAVLVANGEPLSQNAELEVPLETKEPTSGVLPTTIQPTKKKAPTKSKDSRKAVSRIRKS